MTGGVTTATAVVAISSGHPSGNWVVYGVAVIGGIVAWRSRRGDFYKSVAEEKKEQVDDLRERNEKLELMTDITPIIDALHGVTDALERHAEMSATVVQKVADMNGSLRAHSTAMQALADRLVVDEAARALLHESSMPPRDKS